jgi:2-hydroxy-3-keto-5-methylthiopentenyl-1-phosphate phosphatase
MPAAPIVALIYDFDKTLSPKDMQEYGFLPGLGIDPDAFWADCRKFAVEHLSDGVLAYMYMMQRAAHAAGKRLTRGMLEGLGRSIEFYPGIEDWFTRINGCGVAEGVKVEHYIISSGLKEIIDGSAIAGAFKAVFAASYVYDEADNAIWPATAVNYTAKTQYLFRINKGILDVTNDNDLNAHTPEHQRRIPFANMIYMGDGLTDVPCMKMTKLKGGCSIVVYAPGGEELSEAMLIQGRADFALPADYRAGGGMEETVRMIMRKMRARHDLDVQHQRQMRSARARR